MIAALFGLSIAYILMALNFQLGLIVLSASALGWGLTTNHWHRERLDITNTMELK